MPILRSTISPDPIWDFLCSLKQTAAGNEIPSAAKSIGWHAETGLDFDLHSSSDVLAERNDAGDWVPADGPSSAERDMLVIYLALATASKDKPFVTAHLGQSVDGHIAASNGSSHYVTGPENILHLHRMRALSDAVVVGARTVELDDPLLTTREVSGPNPVRVIIDPTQRLSMNYKVFDEAQTPTVVVHDKRFADETCASSSKLRSSAKIKILELDSNEGRISPKHIVDGLFKMGFTSLFIEGGGLTVSRFLQAGVLTRLQVTVAPLLIGGGIPSITLDEIADLSQALRPPCQTFSVGQDVMFDFDMSQ